jgi:hypothetical protein
MLKVLRTVLVALLRIALTLCVAWCGAAIWFDGPTSRALAGVAAALFVLFALAMLWVVRPPRRGMLAFLLAFAALLAWWFSIPPSNDRDWMPDVGRQPTGEVRGDTLVMHDVRDADYRSDTDVDVRWETRTYDLRKLVGLDLFVSYWGPTLIAHTIMSWEFSDGQHLACSIETRKQVGESYSAVRGFFRQYELYYAFADERDLIGVRTCVRGEHVQLYRLRTPPDRARSLLLDYVAAANELVAHPAFYNAFTMNCTTTIFVHVRRIVGRIPFDWRIFANGHIDEMLYEQGIVNTTLPFEQLRERSLVDAAAQAAAGAPDFSARIRDGRPARPPPPPR